MFYAVYILEDSDDSSWYIGYSTNLQKRIENHRLGRVVSTKKKKDLHVIYAEYYLNKRDAQGRERFLKSGAGRRFLKKQLHHYLTNN